MKQAVLFVQWLDTTFKSNANKGRSIHISSSTTKHKIHWPHALGQVIWRQYCFVFASTDSFFAEPVDLFIQERSRTCYKNEAALAARTKPHLQERSCTPLPTCSPAAPPSAQSPARVAFSSGSRAHVSKRHRDGLPCQQSSLQMF